MAGQAVYTKMVLDATGHARKLVEFERDFTPGYQTAFGIMCETEEPHGFPIDTMLFMDWRDGHLAGERGGGGRRAPCPRTLPAHLFTPQLNPPFSAQLKPGCVPAITIIELYPPSLRWCLS